ncbi:threonine-phosphate decarboxylase CobD [Mesobacillus maritimus]|uniref:threonine-phosphate decarboxylase CobD n=1 Tax=Mesobacillus maritimus TaxID=1643336 RepID=UPI00203CAB20|nr:threonine-phosphate decarboxylase CobD [Mesobacillus maritimus]MCM3670846.1 threonine-phosphate decarboxylase CobD [Mesobacillus maritimus]
MNWPKHGANPKYLFNALEEPYPDKTIDFSANINPLGPLPVIKKNWQSLFEEISVYPDPAGLNLKQKLSNETGLDTQEILLGNGGAEIISLVGRFLADKRVLIVQPAFSEYEQACKANNCNIDYHQVIAGSWDLNIEVLEKKLKNTDAVFFCNPNNPTGLYYPDAVVKELLLACKKQNCLLIIDEAFYDFVYYYESITKYILEFPNLLIIRSMTKMFAIPGLRLGYVLGDSKIIKCLARFQPEWSVNAIALKVGEWCLDSENYRKETLHLIMSEKKRLFAFFHHLQFKVSPSETNFYLVKDPTLDNQFPMFQFLIKRGIIPRHTMNFPGLEGKWLRFAVKSPSENNQLMEAIQQWKSDCHLYL